MITAFQIVPLCTKVLVLEVNVGYEKSAGALWSKSLMSGSASASLPGLPYMTRTCLSNSVSVSLCINYDTHTCLAGLS